MTKPQTQMKWWQIGCIGLFALLDVLVLAGIAMFLLNRGSVIQSPAEQPTKTVVANQQIMPTAIPPKDPIASIRDFIGEPGLAIQKGESHPTAFGRQTQIYQATLPNGNRARFEVDGDSGIVTGFVRLGQSAPTAAVTPEQAQSTALTFAREHYADFDIIDLRSAQAELIDQGANKYYTFAWVQTDSSSGAVLPNEVKVQVNSQTGQVDSYASLRVQVTVPTQPQIDRQAAQQIALQAAKNPQNVKVVNMLLFVSTVPVYEPNGKQALLWQVVIEGTPDKTGYTPGIVVFIDAQTGEVVHVEPYG